MGFDGFWGWVFSCFLLGVLRKQKKKKKKKHKVFVALGCFLFDISNEV